MSKENKTSVNICELLLVVFITLKLVPGNDVNNWSWWWVMSPLWIPLAIFILIMIVTALVCRR